MFRKSNSRTVVSALLLGVLSLGLYVILFHYEKAILDLARQARWMFIVPVAVAFLVSFVHGAFTSAFWDALGVRAKR